MVFGKRPNMCNDGIGASTAELTLAVGASGPKQTTVSFGTLYFSLQAASQGRF